jgi:hypothetical protein
MKKGDFREFVRKIWVENCFEHDSFNEPAWSMSDYFKEYKSFLKIKFREEQRKKNEKPNAS